jgi:hypothetical protein
MLLTGQLKAAFTRACSFFPIPFSNWRELAGPPYSATSRIISSFLCVAAGSYFI